MNMKGLYTNKKLPTIAIIWSLISFTFIVYAQEPSNHPVGFTANPLSSTSIQLNWTGSLGPTLPTGYFIVARISGGTFVAIADGTPGVDDFDFTDPNTNGAVNVTHSVGANTYTFNGLNPQVLYEFEIYAFKGAGAGINFKTGGTIPATSTYTFSTEPSTHTASFLATAFSPQQINLGFSAASTITNADGYIILQKTASAPDVTGVVDGVDPVSLSLVAGTSLVTTIVSAATISYSNTGLLQSTDYQYVLIPYNFDGINNITYNYKTDATIPLATATTPAPVAIITKQTGGVSSSVVSGDTNKAIIGFNAVSDGTQSLKDIVFTLTIDPSAGPLSGFQLVNNGASSTYSGGGTVLGTVAGLTTTTVTFLNINQALSSTPTYFFLISNVSVSGSGNFTTTLTSVSADVGSTSGTGFNQGPSPITPLNATLGQLTTGIAASPLGAGSTSQAIIGFTLSSNGNQTVSLIKIQVSSNPAGKLSNFVLVASTDNSFATTGNNSTAVPTGNIAVTGSGPYFISITPAVALDISPASNTNFFLTANVNGGVTIATPSIKPTLSTTDITLSPSNVTASSITTTTDYSFSAAQTSTITLAYGGQTSIDFGEYNNQTPAGLTTGNSQKIFGVDVADADADTQSTTLTSLTLQLGNSVNLKTIALFDNAGSTLIPGTELNVAANIIGNQITFSGLNYIVPDESSKTIDVYVTFNSAVNDNDIINVLLSAATASPAGSGLAALGTIQTGGTKNPINVVSTNLIFNSLPIQTTPATTFSAIVWATDANGILDVDATDQVNMTESGPGPGNITGGGFVTPVSGVYAFNSLSINLAGTYNLTADDAGGGQTLTAANGVIIINSLGVKITDGLSAFPFSSSLCYGGGFQVVGNIKMEETDPADFASGGIFMLQLPAGFIFDTSVTPILSETGNEVTFNTLTNYYIGNDVVRISYALSGTSDPVKDAITISGLKVRYPTSNPTPIGNILVLDASAQQVKNKEIDAQPHGILKAFAATNVGYDFDVFAFPGQPAIQTGENIFSYLISGIILRPSTTNPATTNVIFSGNGVSFSSAQNAYVFSPASVGFGSYDVMLTGTNATGCQVSLTKTFNVYASSINGLQPEYCINDNSPKVLSVDPLRYDYSLYYPAWNSGTTYSQYSYVSYGGDAYYSITLASINQPPSTNPLVWQKFGYHLANNDFAIQINPSYKYMTSAFNNGLGTVTLTSNNHGFLPGSTLQMYAYMYDAFGNFVFYVPYGDYSIKNVTTNTFDITYFDPNSGSFPTVYGYAIINGTVTNLVNNSTSLTLQVANHGLADGVKVKVTLGGLSDNGVSTMIDDWYTVSNSTTNTFDITTSALGVWDNTGTVDIYNYRITTFIPAQVNTFNSNLGQVSDFYVSFFVNDANGCVVNSTNTCAPFVFSGDPVRLNQLPVLDFTGLSASSLYCNNATAVTLTGNQLDGSFTGSGITDGGANSNTASFNPASGSITQGTPFFINYSFTDTKNCTNTLAKKVLVNSQPVAPTPSQAQFGYCEKDLQPLLLDVSGIGDEFFWYDNTLTFVAKGEIFDARTASVTTASPLTVSFFASQITSGCESSKVKVDLVINALPSATFSNAGQCVNESVQFNGPSGTIASWRWDFGDGNSGTGQNVMHSFTDSKNYLVNLDVISTPLVGNAICRNSKSAPIFIGSNPNIKIGFQKICDGDNTTLGHISTIPLDSIYWDFGDGIIANGKISSLITGVPNTSGTYGAPIHQYAGFGSYALSAVGKTTIGCPDTVNRSLPILKKLTPTSLNPYLMNIANPVGEEGYWQAESTVDSTMTWEFNVPSGLVLTSTEKMWITNASGAYKPNDVSYVNSPCFDLTGFSRPLISIQYLNDTQPSRDGAVLEYSTNSGLTWIKLGDPLTGIEWYNKNLVNALGNIFGWSEKGVNTFKEGFHSLSEIPLANRNNVRIRIKFASDQDTEGEGFAFNNVNIVEKNRLMLIENFTNESATNYTANNNKFKSELINETVKLQYHLTFPGTDAISIDNEEDPSSRAAFYGLANNTNNVPRVYIDGTSDGNFTTNWYIDAASIRSLKTSPFSISISTSPSANTDELTVTASAKALQNINVGVEFKKPIFHIVVIEKTVGTNEFVLRKMLPNSAGTVISLPQNTNDIIDAGPYTWTATKTSIDPTDLAIVAFIQDEVTKEVYQAEILLNPANLPSVVTGLEPLPFAQINIYPNPAQGTLNIQLPYAPIKSTPVSLVDGFGREVFSSEFKISEQEKKINTSEFASGVYIIQIKSSSGEIIRRKVIISN